MKPKITLMVAGKVLGSFTSIKPMEDDVKHTEFITKHTVSEEISMEVSTSWLNAVSVCWEE